MITSDKPQHHYAKLAYLLTSVILAMPVLLWPLPIFFFDNPMLADVLTPTWLLCSALLLVAAVVIDTVLYGISSFKQAIDATLWIVIFAVLSISAVQSQGGSWVLAMLFALHATRSGHRLFLHTQPQQWWLWISWSRDTSAAHILLVWGSVWGVY